MKKNNLIITIAVVIFIIILGGLFYYPNIGKEKISTDVACLVANIPLRQHIHPVLKIFVDDKQETVPANIGLGGTCEHAVHTHDASGTIHVESQDSRQYTLGDFFSVWGKTIVRPNFTLHMTVDGIPYDMTKNDPNSLKLKDKQEVELHYTPGPVI